MKQKLLLLKDVDDLGKQGEVVDVRAGYARNFLIPQNFAIYADPHTLLIQENLKQKRAEQAVVDLKEAQELAGKLSNITLMVHVKVDPEGRMYGSVSAQDIVDLLKADQYPIEKKNVMLRRPIKETGVFDIILRLKEGVEVSIKLKILPELIKEEPSIEQVVPLKKEETSVAPVISPKEEEPSVKKAAAPKKAKTKEK